MLSRKRKPILTSLKAYRSTRKMTTQYLNLPVLPADKAFGLVAEYEADTHPDKVSLIAGAYRDENGRPWVLPSVKEAKQRITTDPTWNHEYLGIAGSTTLTALAKSLIFGAQLAKETNIASLQTVSGTSANHLGALFLGKHLKPTNVFIPDPTWLNHHTVWTEAAPDVAQKTYPYVYDGVDGIDVGRIVDTLESQAEENDVIVLQACAHNPTGMDLGQEQWIQIADVVERKRLFVLFDSAYQGFATGDVDGDAWAVRYFTERFFGKGGDGDIPGLIIAQSFSKNFGLYGERVGALHLVAPQNVSAEGAESQLSRLVRAEYSNPPRFGAKIVETILADEGLRRQWSADLQTMSSRIKKMRTALRVRLDGLGTGRDWAHIEKQIGMFSYTGLREEEVKRLQERFHIYMLPSGRVSVCGLNEGNVDYVARGIAEVVKE